MRVIGPGLNPSPSPGPGPPPANRVSNEVCGGTAIIGGTRRGCCGAAAPFVSAMTLYLQYSLYELTDCSMWWLLVVVVVGGGDGRAFSFHVLPLSTRGFSL